MDEQSARPRIDRDRILDVAERITREEGLGKLTLRRIGTEIGADPTAIYRHFRNKQELLVQLAERLFGRVTALDPSRPWRERMHALIREGLDRFRSHVDIALLLAKAGDEIPGLRLITETSLAMLDEVGLTPEQAAHWYQVIENHVVGTGVYYAVLEQLPEPRLDNLDGVRRAAALLPAGEFPRTRDAAPYLFPDLDQAFDTGTDAILDAIERLGGQPAA
ncbi:TetR/AcrR family transcriptional regulator [Solirubrobacter soli]|uniref:TetR/AcrR family transcriptional regulator n=1 Tax=Solirubrobacter soli TaxID=363832 RepID=UPI0004238CDC|nr:TetR/AcrR family transcriptional regulator [Solirubrobacter soli]